MASVVRGEWANIAQRMLQELNDPENSAVGDTIWSTYLDYVDENATKAVRQVMGGKKQLHVVLCDGHILLYNESREQFELLRPQE